MDSPANTSILEQPIEAMELSNRATNALRNGRIKTIGELVSWTEEQWHRKRLGRRAMDEVKDELARLGLSLAPDPLSTPTLHVYPAGSFHDPILLVGNRSALKALRDAITAALGSGASRAEIMSGDGEGYDLFVARSDEDMAFMPTHYTEEFAQDTRPDAKARLDALWTSLYKRPK